MALLDPASIVYAAAVRTLPRTGNTDTTSTYALEGNDNVDFTLKVAHERSKAGRERCTVRLSRAALVANPLATGQSGREELTVSLTVDRGDLHTPDDVGELYAALLSWLTHPVLKRVAAGET